MFLTRWTQSLRRKSTRSSRQNTGCNRAAWFRPRFEALEDRALLACDVFARGDTLFIIGDNANNSVNVLADAAAVHVICDSEGSVSFDGIRHIKADLRGGDDKFHAQFGDPNSPNPLLLDERSVNVNTGRGGDEVGIIIINSRVGAFDQKVDLGDGNDSAKLEFRDLVVEGTLAQKVSGGGGGDDVGIIIINNRIGPGATADITVTGDAGDDQVDIDAQGFTTDGRLDVDVRGDAGNDQIEFNASTWIYEGGFGFVASGGAGNDLLAVGIVNPGGMPESDAQFALNGDAGHDQIEFSASEGMYRGRFGLIANGGQGHDLLAVGIINPSTMPDSDTQFALNGGAGDDQITARMGIGPVPFLPAVDFNLELDGGAGNDTMLAEGIVHPGELVGFNPQPGPSVVRFNVAMRGGIGHDEITARMGIGPTPFLPPVVHGNFVIDGGAGNDRLDVNVTGEPIPDDNMPAGNDNIPPTDDNMPSGIVITMNGGAGNDRLDVNVVGEPIPNDGMPSKIAITVDGGAGNDEVRHDVRGEFQELALDVKTGDGNDLLFAGITEVKSAHGSVHFDTGRGHDRVFVELTDSALPLPLELLTGDGNDAVIGRVDQFSRSPLGVFVDLGNGNDASFLTFHMRLPNVFDVGPEFLATMNIQVLGGAGNDTIGVHTLVVAPIVFNPFFGVQFPPGAQFRLDVLVDGGRGQDVLDVRGEYASPAFDDQTPRYNGEVNVDVLGGSDTDYLAVLWQSLPTVLLDAIADGGPGVDAGVTSPNVTRVNFEF